MKSFTSLEQLQAYPWPEVTDELFDGMTERGTEIKASDHIAYAHTSCTIWECAWGLRSMEILMMDMAMEDEKATWMLDKVTSIQTSRAVHYAATGIDVLHLMDDIGMPQAIQGSRTSESHPAACVTLAELTGKCENSSLQSRSESDSGFAMDRLESLKQTPSVTGLLAGVDVGFDIFPRYFGFKQVRGTAYESTPAGIRVRWMGS